MTTQPTIDEVSARLRAIRISKSLTLTDVESLSKGALKAVVLGSYERGARSLSVKKALAIAQLYQVPVSQLFSDEAPLEVFVGDKAVIDLRAINRRALDEERSDNGKYVLLSRMAQRIVRSRQDWNGEVLSLRQGDIENLSILLDQQISETLQWLDVERILLKRITK